MEDEALAREIIGEDVHDDGCHCRFGHHMQYPLCLTLRDKKRKQLAAALARVRGEWDGALREAGQALANFAWTAVKADHPESAAYLNSLLVNLRAALSAPPACGVKGCTLPATHGDEPHSWDSAPPATRREEG